MKFVIDMQLPRALSRALRSAGHDAEHVRAHLPARAPDDEIWKFAVERGAAIITKDEDFVGIGSRQGDRTAVVWLRCGNTSNTGLIELVLRRLPFICATLEAGAMLIEIR